MSIEVKTGILWEPDNLYQLKPFFSLLTISKKDKVPSYRQDRLSKSTIDKLKNLWSMSTANLLSSLSIEAHSGFEAALFSQKQKMGNNPQAQTIFDNALEKHRHGILQRVLQSNTSVHFYHKTLNPETGNPLTERCRWQQESPQLVFDVVKVKGKLDIQVHYILDEKEMSLKHIERFGFMLRQKNQWYCLSLKDSKTLDWLQANPPTHYGDKPESFSEKVLTKLEAHYQVNRNNHFQINEIKQLPESSVLFTELSGSFLMLTPRWQYDGFLVDGNWKETEKKTQKGVQYIIHRDQQAEEAFIQYIQNLHPDFPDQASRGYYYLSFISARKKQWFLKTFRNMLDNNVGIVGLDMLQHFRYSPFEADTSIEIRNQTGSKLELEVFVRFGDEEVPPLSIQKMLMNGQRNVLLKDDSIAFFSDEWMTKYMLFFKHAVVYKNRMTMPSWLMLGQAIEHPHLDGAFATISKDWRDQWIDWQQDNLNIPVPEMVQTTLRPYQHKGFEWMVLLSRINAGACLADDMGLGKTLQTICFIAYQHIASPERKSVVVCPASLIYNWEQEIQKFAPSLKTFVYRPQQGQNQEAFSKSDCQVLIIGYHSLRSEIDFFKSFAWQVAVIDESQHIKNPSAQITKAVYELDAFNKIALSGTPIMNNTFDLYAQLHFLLPGLMGSREFFMKEYANPIDRYGDEDKIFMLRQLTNPFILRRTKKQVATDLPEKTEMVLWCEMSEEQQEFYDEVKADIRSSIFLGIKNEGFQRSKLNILQGILRLRQICDAPQLIPNEGDYTPCSSSIKMERLMEELTELKASGNKALVFSQFTGMLDLIAERCAQEAIAFYHFDGSTAIEDRRDMVAAFQQEEDETTVFLISLKSGNAGLNLTNAQYVYLVDPWWNQAVEQQAIDRTHRIGQRSNVFAYRMICKGSIEEKIISLQHKKKQLSDDLVGAEEGFVKNMTEDELMYLFS